MKCGGGVDGADLGIYPTIEQMWLPAGDDYTQRRQLKLGKRVESVTITGLTVESDGLI